MADPTGNCTHDLTGKRVAVLSTHGFEQSELTVPVHDLRAAGAEVHIVSPEDGQITGWSGKDWGDSVPVDRPLSDVTHEDYDALVLPGGQINPDILRIEPKAVALVRAFFDAKKPIGAICHAPWLLIEAGVVSGRKVTSWPSVRTDLINAGADWVDEEVVCHQALVTSRNPGDLPAFVAKLGEEIAEGRHPRRQAA